MPGVRGRECTAHGALLDLDTIAIEETYDLVVVGAGISGLSSAAFYLEPEPGARLLIFETNDDI